MRFYTRFLLFLLVPFALITSCKNSREYEKVFSDPQLYSNTVKKLSDIMVENIFSPNVASRNYAYSNIAAYEVVAGLDNKNYRSLKGQIHGLNEVPLPDKNKKYNIGLASVIAFSNVAQAVTFPEGSMKEYIDSVIKLATDNGMPDDMIANSVEYAKSVSDTILSWAKKDKYAQTRSAPKYTVSEAEGRWTPTPPAYMSAVEPSWNKIRTLVIDSASQFKPVRPPVYNMKDTNSAFYKEAKEVMTVAANLNGEQKDIAGFWDCNPFAVEFNGHVMVGLKKISPVGHWMNICGIVAGEKPDFNKNIYAYTLTSIAIFDGVISCWDEKFRSNMIRPETVINKYLDPHWRPLLQTPPFPEYLSGHSVISNASATVLSKIYGEKISFRDTSEVEFGIKPRSFNSFRDAADEAALSRLYGGIHYRAAIQNGSMQGVKVGNFVLGKLEMELL
jgi:hypothetical protein